MRSSILLPTLLSAALAPATAGAVDVARKLGLGYESTLSGASGLSVRYQATRTFGLGIVAGFGSSLPEAEENQGEDVMYLSGGFDVDIAHDDRGRLTVGSRISLGTSDPADPSPDEEIGRVTDLSFEVPFTMEYFLTDHFSLHAGVGAVIATLHDDRRVLLADSAVQQLTPPAAGTALVLGAGEILANAGFTIWL